MSQRIDVLKQTTSVLTFIGVAQIVSSVAINNTDTSRFGTRLTVGMGSIFLGAMIADATCRHKNSIIDSVAKNFRS